MNKKKNKVSRILSRGYKTLIIAMTMIFMVVNEAATVYATEATTSADADAIVKQVTGPINILTTALVTIFAGFGTLWLSKAVPELVTAIQGQDNSGIFHAARSIGCAILLGGLPLIIKLFA